MTTSNVPSPRTPRVPPLPSGVRDRLRKMSELRGLSDSSFEKLLSRVWYRRLPKGTRFIVEDADAEAAFFVLSGEIRVIVGERTVELTRAPTTIGFLSLLDGAPRTASVEAFTDIDVVMLDRVTFDGLLDERPDVVFALVNHLTAEIRAAQKRDEEARRAFDDHFHSPNARLIQGPYRMGDFSMTAFVVQSTPERVAACLPPGLRPMFGGRYLLTFNDFPSTYSEHPSAGGKTFAYRETTPFIPVLRSNGRPGVFSPELYLDSYMPIVLGRELYGFPKRFGVAEFHDTAIDLQIGSSFVLRASWESAAPAEAGDIIAGLQRGFFGIERPLRGHAQFLDAMFRLADVEAVRSHWPAMPVYVHSLMPDPRAEGDSMRIDELVEIPFHVHSLGQFQELRSSKLEGFEDWILAGDAVYGARLQMSATFGRARRPVDYRQVSTLRRAVAPWQALLSAVRQARR